MIPCLHIQEEKFNILNIKLLYYLDSIQYMSFSYGKYVVFWISRM